MNVKRMYASLALAVGLAVTFWPVVLLFILGQPASEIQKTAAAMMFFVAWAGFYALFSLER